MIQSKAGSCRKRRTGRKGTSNYNPNQTGAPYPTGDKPEILTGLGLHNLEGQEEMAMDKVQPTESHDQEILSHIKWASKLIYAKAKNKNFHEQYSDNIGDARFHFLKGTEIKTLVEIGNEVRFGSSRSRGYTFPIGKMEKAGIISTLLQTVIIAETKGHEIPPIKVAGRPGLTHITVTPEYIDWIVETSEGRPAAYVSFFVLTIIDKSKLIFHPGHPGKRPSMLIPRDPWYTYPFASIKFYPKPLRDKQSRIGLPKRTQKKYIAEKTGRVTLKILYNTQGWLIDPNVEKERSLKSSLLEIDPSYKPIDYLMQIEIYLTQQGLLSGSDCILNDFKEYVSSKYKSVPVGSKTRKKSSIDLSRIDHKKALNKIINNYYLPNNPSTFEAYTRRVIAGMIWDEIRNPSSSARESEKNLRKEWILDYMNKKGVSYEAARRTWYRRIQEIEMPKEKVIKQPRLDDDPCEGCLNAGLCSSPCPEKLLISKE